MGYPINIKINVDEPSTAAHLHDLLWGYIQGRDTAVMGVHQFQPDEGWTVTEMRTSRGWHWFIQDSNGRGEPLASAYIEERRSVTPGAADPGVRTLDLPDGVNAQRYGSPVDSTVRDILAPKHAMGGECDICDGRGFDYIGRQCRRAL